MPSTPSPSGWTHSVIPWKMKMQVCGYFFFFFRSEWIALDKENEATHHFYKEKKSSPDQHPKNTMAFFFFFVLLWMTHDPISPHPLNPLPQSLLFWISWKRERKLLQSNGSPLSGPKYLEIILLVHKEQSSWHPIRLFAFHKCGVVALSLKIQLYNITLWTLSA